MHPAAARCHVTLPDGATRDLPAGSTAADVARAIGPRLARQAVGAWVEEAGGERRLFDTHTPLPARSVVHVVTPDAPESLDILRHSTAHVLACAVQALWPGTQVTIGPTIAHGFYYDFMREAGFSPEDLARISAKMREVIAQDLPFVREVMSREAMRETFARLGETFKLEIIDAIDPAEALTVYHLGDWLDLCRGPHLPSSGRIKAFELTHTAGAFWRGDETRPQLTRVYGTAFWRGEDLRAHLAQIEAAKKRDHRRVGRDLELFYFHPHAPAMPFFLPAGAHVYRALVSLMQRFYRALHFEEVITPQLFSTQLFTQSGHMGNYADNMYFCTGGDHDAALKPMNCPSHALLFGMRPRSWRELPWRVADFGRLHRYERSGAIGGLTRVRSFCQDDAHIFCRHQQVGEEISEQLAMIREIYELFGFEMKVALSGRPARSLGREPGLDDAARAHWDGLWARAEGHLEAALTASGLPFTRHPSDGAFYGPKIDCEVEDALGRWHQLGTIQLDFGLPERFELAYIDEAGEKARPVMVHRAVLGSLERFIGILVEHTGGDWPLWLAPVQVRVIPIGDPQAPYADRVAQALLAAGLRVRVDGRREKLGFKIRDAELGRVPVSMVVGAAEEKDGTVALRWRRQPPKAGVPLDQGVAEVLEAAAEPRPSAALAAGTVARLGLRVG